MSSKKSIYLSTASEAVIGTIRDDDSLSGRINSMIVRYGAIMDAFCPQLAFGEWMLLRDILNSTWREVGTPRQDIAPRLWMEVIDSEPDGVAEKWNVDLEPFAVRLRTMTYPEQCSAVEVINRFLSGNHQGEYLEILTACGAKFPAS